MIEMAIDKNGCRGCGLCIATCPTEVIEFDDEEKTAYVSEVEDCIACLSCKYICPSNAIRCKKHDIVVQNFYKDIEFIKISRKII